MNIVVLDGFTLNPGDLSWEQLSKLGQLAVYERTPAEKIVERALEAEIIFTNKVTISGDILRQLPKLRYIGIFATGYNVVDLESARLQGVVVTNIPAYSTSSVSQLVFAHILNFCHRVEFHAQEVRTKKWSENIDFSFWSTPQTELEGRTLGIMGFGKIGHSVARLGYAFGMKIIFNNRSVKKNIPEYCRQVSVEEIFATSDFVSINMPLTNENAGFVNRALLSLMKPAAFLINTGRGLLINENDLAVALNSGVIAGAGLDVLSTEPPQPDNPLLTAKNCFITPHIGWATLEARRRLMNIAVENLKMFLAGVPQNVVQ